MAGRTDTGVHALGQVVSVRVGTGPPAANAALALNAVLPADVVVRAAQRGARWFQRPLLGRGAGLPLPRAGGARAERARGAAGAAPPRRARPRRARPVGRRARRHARLHGVHADGDAAPDVRADGAPRRLARGRRGAALHDRGASFLRHQVRTLVGTMLLAGRGEACATTRRCCCAARTAQRRRTDRAAARPVPRGRPVSGRTGGF